MSVSLRLILYGVTSNLTVAQHKVSILALFQKGFLGFDSNYCKTVCLSTASLQFAKHMQDSASPLNKANFGLFVSCGLSTNSVFLLVTQRRKDCMSRRNVFLFTKLVKGGKVGIQVINQKLQIHSLCFSFLRWLTS